jgi:hypothetical protein
VPNAQLCVYLTIHITRLQLQTTFQKPLYISHFACIHGTLAAENLDVCTACDSWDSWPWGKIGDDKYMLLVTREIADHGERLEMTNICWVCCWYWYQNLGGAPPLGAGHVFLRQQHMCRRGYLFLRGFSSLYDAIHGWMTGWMDGWMESFNKTNHDVLYYM